MTELQLLPILNYNYSITLDDIIYNLSYKWSIISGTYSFEIYNEDGQLVLGTSKLRINANLLNGNNEFLKGEFILESKVGEVLDEDIFESPEDFVKKCRFYYLS